MTSGNMNTFTPPVLRRVLHVPVLYVLPKCSAGGGMRHACGLMF